MQPISDTHEHPAKRCAKCLTPMSSPDWVVNKDMAYCIECAALLHLGESKESRMFSDMRDPVPQEAATPASGPGLDPAGGRPGGEAELSGQVSEDPTGLEG